MRGRRKKGGRRIHSKGVCRDPPLTPSGAAHSVQKLYLNRETVFHTKGRGWLPGKKLNRSGFAWSKSSCSLVTHRGLCDWLAVMVEVENKLLMELQHPLASGPREGEGTGSGRESEPFLRADRSPRLQLPPPRNLGDSSA